MSLSRFFAAAFGFEWLPEKHQAYYVSETINRLDVQVSYTRYERGWAAGQELGLVKLGTIALDGTKVRANASKQKAMSYGREGAGAQA